MNFYEISLAKEPLFRLQIKTLELSIAAYFERSVPATKRALKKALTIVIPVANFCGRKNIFLLARALLPNHCIRLLELRILFPQGARAIRG